MGKQVYYSAERNVQILVYLLKKHNIKKIVISPGATNMCLVASLQNDDFFELYSCVDERSAAYMAVGMANEIQEAIALSCTGATSSRNYMPALTEAYYRKLPIIAITSSMDNSLVGHLWAQVTDRSQKPKDVVKDSIYVQNVRSENDEWDCGIKINYILQYAKRRPSGPVHINIATGMGGGYNVKELPSAPYIKQYCEPIELPLIPSDGHVGIYIGEHKKFTEQESNAIDEFCKEYNAVAFCDHTSNFYGNSRFMYSLIGAQDNLNPDISHIRLLIHIGEMSGDYDTIRGIKPKEVWRVSDDGCFKDRFRKLTKVFTMSELNFFKYYLTENNRLNENLYLSECKNYYIKAYEKISILPFSNIYIAKYLSKKMPKSSILYLGILNTLRSWNFFNVTAGVKTYSNVGGFGIDGIMSSMIGSSFVEPKKMHFAILGDLSFFYDLNSLGNRDIKSNVRILLINNGHGQEFTNYTHAASVLGSEADKYVAAKGHFDSRSKELVKHYAQDLGFLYLRANNIDEFNQNSEQFLSADFWDKPIIFETFTNDVDENEALRIVHNLLSDTKTKVKNVIKKLVNP